MSKEISPEQEKLQAQRQRALDAAMLQIQKDFGETAIMRLGDKKTMEVEVIPTGNLLIDRALGAGGVPRGRIVEVFGPESSGKTTLTLTVIAQAQRAGGLAAFIDVEHALDPAYAAKIHPNDSQRTVRALEVWESTGRTFTWWHEQTPPPAPYDVLRIGIGLPLQELTPFLERRISIMMDMGAMDEAIKALRLCPDIEAPAWSGIGCAETAAFLKGSISLEDCLDRWKRNTRAYAKRQWTWFRADKRILWHRPGEHAAVEAQVRGFLGI